jgi:rhodanese-related sulfurtransferase
MSMPTILPQQLEELRAAGKNVELIDVRTPLEYRALHVAYARNIPLDQLDPQAIVLSRSGAADEPLYVICHSGNRGQKACEKLRAAGLVNVVNVEGGTLAWTESGLPVIRGKKAISLDRQVRITIGLLVVAGVILGWLLDPIWTGLSAFMGAGLIYAGVFDSCPLGMLMARMPWNRVQETGGCCQTSAMAGNGVAKLSIGGRR